MNLELKLYEYYWTKAFIVLSMFEIIRRGLHINRILTGLFEQIWGVLIASLLLIV